MKILFFWPGVQDQPSLGLPLLMTLLKNAGHEIGLFSTSEFHPYPRSVRGMLYKTSANRENKPDRMSYERDWSRGIQAFIAVVDKFGPDVIGMSAMSTNYLIGLKYLQALEPKPFILVGGVHATLCPQEVLEHPFVDAVCVGEGEATILEFAKRIDTGALKTRKFSDVPNLWFKDTGSHIRKNQTGSFADLDSMPPVDPEYVGTFKSYFIGKEYINASFETSRGCPFSCTYCCNDAYKKAVFGSHKPSIRRMKPAKAIAHLQGIKEKATVTMVRFVDENLLTAPSDWLEEFCVLYKKEIRLPFQLMASANTITDERIRMIKEAGCVNINFGIESGNEKYRTQVLKKPITDKQLILARRVLEDYEIRASGGIMIGLPGQTNNIIWDTIRLIRKLRIPVSNEYFVPLPGSPMYNELIRDGSFKAFQEDYDCYRAMGEPIYIPHGMTKEEVVGIARTTLLYAHLPESLWPVVALCAKESETTDRLLDALEMIFAF